MKCFSKIQRIIICFILFLSVVTMLFFGLGRLSQILGLSRTEETEINEESNAIMLTVPINFDKLESNDFSYVYNELTNAGFVNVKGEALQDLDSAEFDGAVAEITVDGQPIEYDKQYRVDEEIVILHHSIKEESLPSMLFESEAIDYEKAVSSVEETGFSNVEIKLVQDIAKDNTIDGEVEWIEIDGKKAEPGRIYPVTSNVVVAYSNKLIDVSFDITCEKNFIFNKYDIEVCVDGESIGIVKHGEHEHLSCKLEKGNHIAVFYKSGDKDISSTYEFTVLDTSTFSIGLSCKGDAIEIKTEGDEEIPQDDNEYDIDKVHPPHNSFGFTGKYMKVKKEFEDAGFKNVKLRKVKNPTFRNEHEIGDVEKILVDGESIFSKSDYYPKNVKVEIWYKSGSDTITVQNSKKFEQILMMPNTEDGREQCKEFFKKNNGRIIEFDGLIIYSQILDETTQVRCGFYPGNSPSSSNLSFMTQIITSLEYEKKGLDKFPMDRITSLDYEKVHVKAIIEFYDSFDHCCSISLVKVEKRK